MVIVNNVVGRDINSCPRTPIYELGDPLLCTPVSLVRGIAFPRERMCRSETDQPMSAYVSTRISQESKNKGQLVVRACWVTFGCEVDLHVRLTSGRLAHASTAVPTTSQKKYIVHSWASYCTVRLRLTEVIRVQDHPFDY
jgi:hypothetical protein